MINNMTRRAVAPSSSDFWEKTKRKTKSAHMKVPMTDARRPPKRSETYPTIIPPGIIPTEYREAIRLAVTGSKCFPKKYGSQKKRT